MSLRKQWPQLAVWIVMVLAATSAIAAQQPTASVVPAIVVQPRPFGYVVGDLVTQRVLLTTPNVDFQPAALPTAQRLNIWFERRAPKIESAADGRRWLVVDYQVINAPQTLTTVGLPAWELEAKAGGARLKIPAAPINVAPLIPSSSVAAGSELRPDREVPIVATAPARSRLIIWSIALVAVLAAWLTWLQWRNWRDSLNKPFARALQEVRRVDEVAPEAWQALHRAFDQTAGHVLQIQTLPTLFQRAPHLEPLRVEIERFFAQSSERFFGAGLQSNVMSVRALCNELRRIEKRYAQ
jgi:mxaA protein